MGEAEEVQEKMKADMEAMKEQMATMMEAMKSTEGQAVGGIPFENTLEGPQFRPQPQPLRFVVGRALPAMAEKGKADHLKERLRAIEGGEDYAFAKRVVPRTQYHHPSQVQGAGP